jgi:hypothetical protein
MNFILNFGYLKSSEKKNLIFLVRIPEVFILIEIDEVWYEEYIVWWEA